MAPSWLNGPTMRVAAAAVALLMVGKAAWAQEPPPRDVDTSVCHGRGAPPPKNGRLIGHVKGERGLYSVQPGGSGLRRETRPPNRYDDFFPAPSRDGRSIAFLRLFLPSVDARAMRLMTVDRRTRKTRVVTTEFFQEFAPAWTPDGAWITAGTVQDASGRVATAIRPDGTGRRNLVAGDLLLLNGSWSPNGRCFAADARIPGPSGPGSSAGIAVVDDDISFPFTFFPRAPCSSSTICGSNIPSFGPNEPNYVAWTSDGRGLITLRGEYRRPPRDPYASPDQVDVMRSELFSSRPGRVLVRNAIEPHLAPDGRFLTAYSIRRRTFAVFGLDGRVVHRFPRFRPEAWAAAQR